MPRMICTDCVKWPSPAFDIKHLMHTNPKQGGNNNMTKSQSYDKTQFKGSQIFIPTERDITTVHNSLTHSQFIYPDLIHPD